MTIERHEQPRYRITIYYDGRQYVAEVSDLVGCVGHGWSYAAALANAEKAIHERTKAVETQARKKPETSKPLIYRDHIQQYTDPQAMAGTLLQKKFGKLSMESLRLQIAHGCSTTAFISAMNGNGTREARILIALALGVAPSSLWGERAYMVKKRDNEVYLERRQLLGMTQEDSLGAA